MNLFWFSFLDISSMLILLSRKLWCLRVLDRYLAKIRSYSLRKRNNNKHQNEVAWKSDIVKWFLPQLAVYLLKLSRPKLPESEKVLNQIAKQEEIPVNNFLFWNQHVTDPLFVLLLLLQTRAESPLVLLLFEITSCIHTLVVFIPVSLYWAYWNYSWFDLHL